MFNYCIATKMINGIWFKLIKLLFVIKLINYYWFIIKILLRKHILFLGRNMCGKNFCHHCFYLCIVYKAIKVAILSYKMICHSQHFVNTVFLNGTQHSVNTVFLNGSQLKIVNITECELWIVGHYDLLSVEGESKADFDCIFESPSFPCFR